jgi:hypothetical protein
MVREEEVIKYEGEKKGMEETKNKRRRTLRIWRRYVKRKNTEE